MIGEENQKLWANFVTEVVDVKSLNSVLNWPPDKSNSLHDISCPILGEEKWKEDRALDLRFFEVIT